MFAVRHCMLHSEWRINIFQTLFRCIFVNVNPYTALRNASFDPLKTLRKFRQIVPKDKSPGIGILLGVRQTGIVHRGDAVYIEDE